MFHLHFCTLTGSGDVFIPICFTVYGRCVKHVARGSETARQRVSKGFKGFQSLVSTSSKSPGLLALHHLLLHISLNSTKHNLFIF